MAAESPMIWLTSCQTSFPKNKLGLRSNQDPYLTLQGDNVLMLGILEKTLIHKINKDFKLIYYHILSYHNQ